MASLYKNRESWYLAVCIKGKRINKSLGTKDKSVALKLRPFVEISIINQVKGIVESNAKLSFEELVSNYLRAHHSWSPSTYYLNKYILTSHLNGKPLPGHPTSRAIHIRHVNLCWNWGLKNNLVEEAHLIPDDTKGEARHRTYTADELKLMLDNIKDASFNRFVRFAYYTSARSGEIRSILRDNVLEGCIGRSW